MTTVQRALVMVHLAEAVVGQKVNIAVRARSRRETIDHQFTTIVVVMELGAWIVAVIGRRTGR